MKRKKGYFSISAVAKMFSVHQQTIRLYEKEGLISPKRSAGNTRLFSEDDVDRLEEIIYLTHKVGVNLAGVEMIMRLQKKVSKLQQEMNKLFDQTQGDLEADSNAYKQTIREEVKKLQTFKKDTAISTEPIDEDEETDTDKPSSNEDKKNAASDDWDIDYDV